MQSSFHVAAALLNIAVRMLCVRDKNGTTEAPKPTKDRRIGKTSLGSPLFPCFLPLIGIAREGETANQHEEGSRRELF